MRRRLYTEDYLRRKALKGSTEIDENLKLLCEIRHKFTNYEKLAVFYNLFPSKRSELNRAINTLINVGPDGITQFKEKVKKLEEYVNLNNKKAKKRFLEKEEQRIRKANPDCMDSIIKEYAKNNLNGYIRLNNQYIEKKRKQKEYENEN